MLSKFKNFLLESRQELSRVTWPSTQETVRLTGVVIIASVAIALFLGASDAVFLVLFESFIF